MVHKDIFLADVDNIMLTVKILFLFFNDDNSLFDSVDALILLQCILTISTPLWSLVRIM
jgi:hypothetical protein